MSRFTDQIDIEDQSASFAASPELFLNLVSEDMRQSQVDHKIFQNLTADSGIPYACNRTVCCIHL